ncbi:MAG: fatty acid desaturase CarF family protein [Candidatus Pacebacteria bacterium]|nr:fatty acid desaturase CarF family protein [Candidatus Paceibacterota bacterium]MDD5356978.1 fatty acid desaturase CarF family protein [Candidatus Paceibacterota bacterium]
MAKIQQPNIEEIRMKTDRTRQILRLLAFLSICIFFLLAVGKFFLHREYFSFLSFVAIFLGSLLVADFLSGVMHWAFDTWGSSKTFLVGPLFIRPFREHHVDEKSITHHSFIQASTSGTATVIPVCIAVLLIPLTGVISYSILMFVFLISVFVFLTNQIHKWAHMDNPPAIIRFLQKTHILLPQIDHHIHHIEPFTQSYAITTGWTNPFFTKFQFFRHAEKIITRITGAIPRADDIGVEAAKELMEKGN